MAIIVVVELFACFWWKVEFGRLLEFRRAAIQYVPYHDHTNYNPILASFISFVEKGAWQSRNEYKARTVLLRL